VEAVWSIGSNLGDRMALLRTAVRAIGAFDGLRVSAVSDVYETAPWGPVEQDDYLNAVLVTTGEVPARTLLGVAHVVEAAAGRERTVRWGPRTLDVDLVTVGDVRLADADLELPHPRAHERAFVLVPWLAACPAAELPGQGPVAALVATLAAGEVAGVRHRPDLGSLV
jgi:2-amino-4-hydroxy-6-hydroxymethyldihydropteridine diphosphokinase